MTQFETFYSLVGAEDLEGAIQAAVDYADAEETLTGFLREGFVQSMSSTQGWTRDGGAIWKEHIRSEILDLVLANLRLNIEAFYQKNKKGAAPVIVACPDGETHTLGAKVTTSLLRIKGFNARFIGADLPADQLMSLVDSVKPAAVVFSVTHHYNLLALKDTITQLKGKFPQLLIAAGGASLRHNADAFPEVRVVTNHDALFEMIRGELR
ncbi:cobalamin B12-binding domain-containing protein [Acidaminobacter sp.]|uniref:cobalamin B12-binding domain-containing protein n=1 Tax=Acidaminobacter sp. TaxID=1872102 RepID=UPI0013820E54|nr:cobalamin B12-binding domain-containing protein [Acidaminobacter sp.]MDK9711644.1 cobalamin B12-binding domain-containing protein [Acidaminobacter sp.]MZQ98263.1 hypothetical protein [Acidaminobacter sp.]